MCFSAPHITVPANPGPPSPPPPTPEELELQKKQNELLTENLAVVKQQKADEAATRAAFEQATGMPYADYVAKNAASQGQLMQDLQARFSAAAKGDLPVSPGLERNLTRARDVLMETLRRNVPGADPEATSPGMYAIGEFDKNAEALRDSARRGAISEAEQYGLSSSPLIPAQVAQPQMKATPPQLGDLYNEYLYNRSLGAQFGLAGYQGLADYNRMRVGANTATAANQTALNQALIQGMSGLAGAGLGAAMM